MSGPADKMECKDEIWLSMRAVKKKTSFNLKIVDIHGTTFERDFEDEIDVKFALEKFLSDSDFRKFTTIKEN